jgi:hypothetical protein
MPRLLPPLALMLLLSACSSLFAGGGQKLINPPPPGISYRVENNDLAATDRKAQDYCARYGKTAKRGEASKVADGTVVQYSCS